MSTDVKIEPVGPAKKRLTITVPGETISEKLEESLGTLMHESQLPGFRKGRAPRHLIEKRFGSAVRNETKSQVIADAYTTAIDENKIRTVGEPEPTDNFEELELEAGKALTFSVDVEVVPEFDLPSVEKLEVLKPSLEITDEMVDQEVERQCLGFGEPSPIEDGKYVGLDRIRGAVKAFKNDEEEPFFHHASATMTYPRDEDDGKGVVLGLSIEDLAKKLKGKKPGDSIVIETVGPDAHEQVELRGAKIRIEFDIEDAQHITAAPLETVIENYGMSNEDMLREQVRLALEQRRDQEQAAAMREQVADYLMDAVDFELPEDLSAAQAERNLRRQEMELLYRGIDPEEVERRLADTRGENESGTKRRLKLFFLLHRFADEFEISVNEQEINGRVAAMAAQNNMRPEQLRAQLAQSGRLNEIAMQIREHKAADRIVQDATVKDISAEDWAEHVKKRQAKNDA
ncbi:MAG: trigger factor [Planctomycetota bacterium]